jgi:hypothetical protein
MDVEAQRLSNLEYKHRLLAELNLSTSIKRETPDTDTHRPKRRKLALPADTKPSRSSARIHAQPRPSYRDDKTDTTTSNAPMKKLRPATTTRSPTPPTALVPIKDVDAIVAGWTAWTPTASPPTRSETAHTFHFTDQPSFTPNKSPEEMLREGVFGGSYFRPLRSKKLGVVVRDDWRELPSDWIEGLDSDIYLTGPEYDASVNKFGVSCGQSIEEWEAAGWIAHEYDVRGWFQWYCRFWQGRRCEDDERQISRWRKCVGETGRWRRMLLKKYISMGVREVFDDGEEEEGKEVSPVMHQTCLHWAYEVRQEDLDRAWNGG